MSLFYRVFLALSAVFLVTGCASGTFKARQEQREKMAASSGMFCDFVSAALSPDVDVELSMQMARRCDSTKNFSITNYRSASDEQGVLYCCATSSRSIAPKKSSVKKAAPKGSNTDASDDEVIAE